MSELVKKKNATSKVILSSALTEIDLTDKTEEMEDIIESVLLPTTSDVYHTKGLDDSAVKFPCHTQLDA